MYIDDELAGIVLAERGNVGTLQPGAPRPIVDAAGSRQNGAVDREFAKVMAIEAQGIGEESRDSRERDIEQRAGLIDRQGEDQQEPREDRESPSAAGAIYKDKREGRYGGRERIRRCRQEAYRGSEWRRGQQGHSRRQGYWRAEQFRSEIAIGQQAERGEIHDTERPQQVHAVHGLDRAERAVDRSG